MEQPGSTDHAAATPWKTHSCCLRISSMSAFSVLLLALRALSSSFSNSVRWAFFIASIAKIGNKKVSLSTAQLLYFVLKRHYHAENMAARI